VTLRPPEVISDPLGVIVKLVVAVDPALPPAVVEELVKALAPSRATRRRLAQALYDRPDILAAGRSPAPRVAGDLLVALRRAGSERISPPCCATCGKHLRTFQRRGLDWYCSVCGAVLVACASCGEIRRITWRDRAGNPRCHGCPPDDGPDPVQVILEVVARVDPGIPAETVAAAVAAVTSRTGQRRQLAWALSDRPALLTGEGGQAGVPSVLRLIEVLCDNGATGIVRPACPRCHRVIRLNVMVDGVRVCRNCKARARVETCGRCGVGSEPATRDENGKAVCSNCFVNDPENHEVCVGCGNRRPVNVRSEDGPRCQACRPRRTMTCSICGRSVICEISRATNEPWCNGCQQRWEPCAGCGQVRPVRGGTTEEPLCATCTQPDPAFWRSCPTCGEPAKLTRGPCPRCALGRRLRELLGDHAGEIRQELQGLFDNLAGHERPRTVLAFLRKNAARGLLSEIGAGERPLTHAALDELPDSKPIRHLRSVLVATGALPARDELLGRLEAWIACTIDREDPEERQVLQRYALWHLLRRLRRRTNNTLVTAAQVVVVQTSVRAAIAFLDWLDHRNLTLASAGQGDLDIWPASSGYREAGHFVRWAAREKLTTLEHPAIRWGGPTGVIDAESRWEQGRWLLSDETVKAEDRVAGLLVLLYAQQVAVISRLTLAHVKAGADQVRLRLGTEPVVLPEPLAALVSGLVDSRRGHAAIGDKGTSAWLFPGGQPGRPVSAERLAERLRQLGLQPRQARSAALFQLATELPAAVVARMLGVHIKVAVEWQRACSGDWASYAASYSGRHAGDLG
jgi:hypothetical protein